MNVYVRYQAPGSAGTYYDADASAAVETTPDTRPKRPRTQPRTRYLSDEIRCKYPDFPVMENKRDQLKQGHKSQPHKKAASNVADKAKQSASSSVVADGCRTDGAVERMDALQ